MKKLGYGLLYGVPGLIFAGFGATSLFSGIGYIGNPYIGVWGAISGIIFPLVFVLLSCLYLFYVFKQENINNYTNWSVLSWYAGIPIFFIVSTILLGVPKLGSEGVAQSFAGLFIMVVVLLSSISSVIFAHIVGLFKGEMKPKILNHIFIIFAVITLVDHIYIIINKFN